jgi:hypothetical protein
MRGKIRATRISFTFPGLAKINPSRVHKIPCKIVFNLYQPDVETCIDLACLAAPDGYHAPNPLALTIPPESVTLSTKDEVSLIGYPGDVARIHLLDAPRILNNDFEGAVQAARSAFPPLKLVETRGLLKMIDYENGILHYEVSTLQGMSGACLIQNGKVYGIHLS